MSYGHGNRPAVTHYDAPEYAPAKAQTTKAELVRELKEEIKQQ